MDEFNRTQNLKAIVEQLLRDNGALALSAQIPTSLEGLRRLMRALENMRPAVPASDEFLRAEAAELQLQLFEKGIVTLDQIPGGQLRIWQGDITRLKVGAIVNAANSGLTGCWAPLHGCIDNAIHSSAGVQLRLTCDSLMRAQGHPEPTGLAKITPAFNLPCDYVLHTVGPIIKDIEPSDWQRQELAGCYSNCLSLAADNGVESIAFCCISTGVFRFPRAEAASIAVRAVRSWLVSHPSTSIKTVIFNVFLDEDRDIYLHELLA